MQLIFTFSFLHILRCFSVIEIFVNVHTCVKVYTSVRLVFPSQNAQCFYISAPLHIIYKQWRSQPVNLVMLCKFFCVYRPYKESISKEMNNDLNLHSMTKLSGWLRHCIQSASSARLKQLNFTFHYALPRNFLFCLD